MSTPERQPLVVDYDSEATLDEPSEEPEPDEELSEEDRAEIESIFEQVERILYGNALK